MVQHLLQHPPPMNPKSDDLLFWVVILVTNSPVLLILGDSRPRRSKNRLIGKKVVYFSWVSSHFSSNRRCTNKNRKTGASQTMPIPRIWQQYSFEVEIKFVPFLHVSMSQEKPSARPRSNSRFTGPSFDLSLSLTV